MEWSNRQKKDSLIRYISHALSLLKDVGFDVYGVTSPWAFGDKVEDAYAKAISDSVFHVSGKKHAWYFLHCLPGKQNIKPWIQYENGDRFVVSIPTTSKDHFWQTIDTTEASDTYVSRIADELITLDGKSGSIIDMLESGCYPLIVTHWQSLISNGLGTGIRALDEVCRRINIHLSDRVEWTTYEDLMEHVISNKEDYKRPNI